jgi:hypothetical protein
MSRLKYVDRWVRAKYISIDRMCSSKPSQIVSPVRPGGCELAASTSDLLILIINKVAAPHSNSIYPSMFKQNFMIMKAQPPRKKSGKDFSSVSWYSIPWPVVSSWRENMREHCDIMSQWLSSVGGSIVIDDCVN